MSGIHRIILNRLLAAWVIVSLATGAIMFYLGIEKIDDQLVELATRESGKFSTASLPLLNHPEKDRSTLSALAAGFVRQHFIVVELYDKDRRKVAEAINPLHASIEDDLKRQLKQDRLGYVRILMFNENTPKELDRAVAAQIPMGAEGDFSELGAVEAAAVESDRLHVSVRPSRVAARARP